MSAIAVVIIATAAATMAATTPTLWVFFVSLVELGIAQLGLLVGGKGGGLDWIVALSFIVKLLNDGV
jgi:hypothetical protein